MDFVHNLRGKHVVYVLQCEPDEQGNETRYVGCSTNIERRTAEHLGLKSGGAAWCKLHKPISVLEVRLCNSKEEAAIMETMLTAVHQSQVGYQCARGSRWNMPGPMKRPPPYFDDAKEYVSPRSDEAEPKTPEAQAEPKTPEWEPPKDLPPCYEKLKEENGIVEDRAPVQCPCFINEKDPTGKFRQLAALLPA